MKTFIVLTALGAGLALSQQASACDWMHQADQKPATTATCEGGNCPTEQQQEAATTATAPAAPQTVEQPAPASPTVVAQGQ